MPNKAFKAAATMTKGGMQDDVVLHALGVAKVHACVLEELKHRMQRRNGGKSDIEIRGFDYRRKHDLGRPLASGLRGHARQPNKSTIRHAERRLRSLEALHGKVFAATLAFEDFADAALTAAASILGLRRFLPSKP